MTAVSNFVRMVSASAGEWVLTSWHYLAYVLGATLGVVWKTFHASAWNRRTRHQFYLQCYFTGNQALPLVLVIAVMCSFGSNQLLRLFEDLGSAISGGEFLWRFMVRDFGPGLIGLVILGRSGTAITAELGMLKLAGKISVGNRQDDPIGDIILPRAAAMALMNLLLGTLFLVALTGGIELQRWATGETLTPMGQLIDGMIFPLTSREAIAFPLKTLITGLIGGIICCVEGLRVSGQRDLARRVARAFSFSVVVSALIQVLVGMRI